MPYSNRSPVRCLGPRQLLVSLLSVVFLCFLSLIPYASSSALFNAMTKAIERGYHGIRNSEAVETLNSKAAEFITGRGLASPSLKVLSAELEGLGLGASCLLESASKHGSAQATYLLAVASKTEEVTRFSSRFNGSWHMSFNEAEQEMQKHLDLLSGAVSLPPTATNSPFLAAEVSAIRPAFFALSHFYINAIERGDRSFIAGFLRSTLPRMRQVVMAILTLMETEKDKEVCRKRRTLSKWISLWFHQDLALLKTCPGADPKKISARQSLAEQHRQQSGTPSS